MAELVLLVVLLFALLVICCALPPEDPPRVTKRGGYGGPKRDPMVRTDRGSVRLSVARTSGMLPEEEDNDG